MAPGAAPSPALVLRVPAIPELPSMPMVPRSGPAPGLTACRPSAYWSSLPSEAAAIFGAVSAAADAELAHAQTSAATARSDADEAKRNVESFTASISAWTTATASVLGGILDAAEDRITAAVAHRREERARLAAEAEALAKEHNEARRAETLARNRDRAAREKAEAAAAGAAKEHKRLLAKAAEAAALAAVEERKRRKVEDRLRRTKEKARAEAEALGRRVAEATEEKRRAAQEAWRTQRQAEESLDRERQEAARKLRQAEAEALRLRGDAAAARQETLQLQQAAETAARQHREAAARDAEAARQQREAALRRRSELVREAAARSIFLQGQTPATRVALVLDQSGSMDCGGWARVASEAKMAIRALAAAGSEFRVVVFNDGATASWSGFRLADDASQAAAEAFIGRFRADGGTCFDAALNEALQHCPEQVFMVTDGIANHPGRQVARAVSQGTRIFCTFIDSGFHVQFSMMHGGMPLHLVAAGGSSQAIELLRSIAEPTGGTVKSC